MCTHKNRTIRPPPWPIGAGLSGSGLLYELCICPTAWAPASAFAYSSTLGRSRPRAGAAPPPSEPAPAPSWPRCFWYPTSAARPFALPRAYGNSAFIIPWRPRLFSFHPPLVRPCALQALRGTPVGATMTAPGAAGSLWRSDLPVLGAPASLIRPGSYRAPASILSLAASWCCPALRRGPSLCPGPTRRGFLCKCLAGYLGRRT